MRISFVAALLLAFVVTAPRASADITSSTAGGFVSDHTMTIKAPRSKVFHSLTAEVGRWWDPQHSYSGDAANFSIDARPDGCFCERLKDGFIVHMSVVYSQRDTVLRMQGGLGPLQEMAVNGTLTFALGDADGGGTRLHYTYAVGGFSPDGLDKLAVPVDQVMLGQLHRLQRYVETGSPEAAPKP